MSNGGPVLPSSSGALRFLPRFPASAGIVVRLSEIRLSLSGVGQGSRYRTRKAVNVYAVAMTRQRDAGRSVSVELKNDRRIARERVTEAMEKIPRKSREKRKRRRHKQKHSQEGSYHDKRQAVVTIRVDGSALAVQVSGKQTMNVEYEVAV